jgi:hypothetical protein
LSWAKRVGAKGRLGIEQGRGGIADRLLLLLFQELTRRCTTRCSSEYEYRRAFRAGDSCTSQKMRRIFGVIVCISTATTTTTKEAHNKEFWFHGSCGVFLPKRRHSLFVSHRDGSSFALAIAFSLPPLCLYVAVKPCYLSAKVCLQKELVASLRWRLLFLSPLGLYVAMKP